MQHKIDLNCDSFNPLVVLGTELFFIFWFLQRLFGCPIESFLRALPVAFPVLLKVIMREPLANVPLFKKMNDTLSLI